MRVAVVTDIHGNRRAFQAVLEDLRQVAPDLVVHGAIWCSAGHIRGKSLMRFARSAGPESLETLTRCYGRRSGR